MKITNISATPYRLPLKKPFHMAHFSVRFMHYVLVKVETDEGFIGYGEATPAWEVNGETCDSVVGYIELLKNRQMTGYSIIGSFLNSLEQLEELIDTVVNPIGTTALISGNSAAKAALEQALYHALCLKKLKSVNELYGIEKKSIPSTTTIGISPIETTIASVKAACKNGASIIRLKIGQKNIDGPGFNRDIQVIIKAKELMTKDQKLIADANQAFSSTDEAVAFCHKIDGCLDWLEQPQNADDMQGFKEISTQTKVPLMADESLTSYKDAIMLLSLGGVDYLNIKLMKVGGMRGALKIIDLASQYGVGCHIGSMIESMLGITMGCYTYLFRPSVVSTDLQVFSLLSDQVATGLSIIKDEVVLNNLDVYEQKVKHYSI